MKYRVKRHAVVQPLSQSYRLIPLTQEKNAIVDAKDFDWLSQWNWTAWWNPSTKSFYARRYVRNSNPQLMHGLLVDSSEEVDHRNRNTLDNRRDNLRPATHAQNNRNRGRNSNNASGFRGVTWSKKRKKWVAQISKDHRGFFLGHFQKAKDAAKAYDDAAREMFGEFASCNFPHIEYSSRASPVAKSSHSCRR